MKPLTRGHPNERPTPLERALDNVNLNIYVLIYTPDERPSLLKGHFSGAKGVASQEGFHYIYIIELISTEVNNDKSGYSLIYNRSFMTDVFTKSSCGMFFIYSL